MYYEWVYNGLPLVIYLIKMILGGFDHRQNVFFGIYTKYLPTISKTLHMDATHNPLFFPELSLHGQFKSEKGGGMAQCGVVLVSLAISDAQGFDQMPAKPQDHEAFSVLLVKICTLLV